MDLKNFASWMAIIGTCILAAFFFGFLAYHSLKKTSSESSWLLKVLETHFAATEIRQAGESQQKRGTGDV